MTLTSYCCRKSMHLLSKEHTVVLCRSAILFLHTSPLHCYLTTLKITRYSNINTAYFTFTRLRYVLRTQPLRTKVRSRLRIDPGTVGLVEQCLNHYATPSSQCFMANSISDSSLRPFNGLMELHRNEWKIEWMHQKCYTAYVQYLTG
jgi:hypothetical protein